MSIKFESIRIWLLVDYLLFLFNWLLNHLLIAYALFLMISFSFSGNLLMKRDDEIKELQQTITHLSSVQVTQNDLMNDIINQSINKSITNE